MDINLVCFGIAKDIIGTKPTPITPSQLILMMKWL